MAYTPFEELDGKGPVIIDSNTQHTLTANGQEVIELPSGDFIADAQMTKDGHDLVLEAPDGSVVVIEGYFLADPAPVLQAPNGAALTPELVDAFAKAPSEFAQTGSLNDESPVGAIEELSGDARIIRTDGTVETVQIGTPVYQGDVIETSGDGAVNIVFIDETSFAISENARMAIDEYVFDPATESGKQNFSVLRGVFVFTSGLIGRDDPDDVEIDTPVGSIGIRGTIIAGDIQPGGESEITVIEGAIVIRNGVNEETLSLQFESVKLNGYDSGIERTGVMDADSVNQNYGSVRNVSPTLFSSIDDAAQEQDNSQNGEASKQQEQKQEAAEQQPADDASKLEGDPDQPVENGEGTTQQQPAGEAAPQEPVPGAQDPALNLDGTKNNFDGQNDAFTGDNTIVEGTSEPVQAPTTAQPSTSGGTQTTTQTTTSGSTGIQTTTQTTTNPPPLGLELQKFDIPVTSVTGGFIVGRVKTTNLFGQVDFTLHGGNGNFELVKTGTHEAVIRLTATGASNLSGIATANFNFLVEAVRNGSATKSVSFSSHIFDPSAGIPDGYGADLFAVGTPGVTVISDSGIGNRIGYSIAGGDFDGNGVSDVIFTNNTNQGAGGPDGTQHHNYVVDGALGTPLADSTAGTHATTYTSLPSGDYNEDVIVNVGDFDGDGIDDYAMGFKYANGAGAGNGEVFIYKSGGGVEALDGTTGSGFGASLSGVGDLNRDGYDDVIVGAPADSGYGSATLTFGNGGAADTTFSEANVYGFGSTVIGAGDFNGDGFADVAVTALDADTLNGSSEDGAVFIYYGNGAGGLNPGEIIEGFDTNGDDLPLFNLGDVNGDGKTDLMMVSIGDNTNAGTAHIVLGTNGALGDTANDASSASTFDLKLHGAGAAGDWNGDGYDDFVLVTEADANTANIYVVYGKDGFGGTINQAWLNDPQNAFKTTIHGIDNINEFDFTISNVGDMNGDGFDEVAIGTPDWGVDDPDGTLGDANNDGDPNNDFDGQVAILYGRETGSNTYVGTNVVAGAHGDHLVGTGGADTLSDAPARYNDVSMRGGAGNDTFLVYRTAFTGGVTNSYDGGSGVDFLHTQDTINFATLDFENMNGIEGIVGNSGKEVTLTLENIMNFLQTSDDGTFTLSGVDNTTTFKFDLSGGASGLNQDTAPADGISDDTSALAAALSSELGGGVSVNDEGGTYDKISIGNYDLYIQDDVAVTIV